MSLDERAVIQTAARRQYDLPSLRQLRAFSAIAAHRSMRRAARAIHLSQPAVSHAMHRLEVDMGGPLLVRTATGAYLTGEGDILLRRVERFKQRLLSAAEGDDNAAWRLTLPQIRSLVTIAQTGSFAEAARRLGISEPSLHRAARDIEAILHRTLYHRTPEGVAVTKQGARAARELNLALRELDNALEEISLYRGKAQSRLLIGALPLVRTLLLPRAVNAITERYAGTTVVISDGAYDPLLSALRGGDIDILFGALRNPAPADDVVEQMMFMDRFAIVARANHPLARKSRIAPGDLARYDWIIARNKTPIRAAFSAFFAEHGIAPHASVETSSLVTIRGMLMESDKITLLSRHQILFEESAGLLTVLPVEIPNGERPIGMTVRRDWLPTDLQADFIKLIRNLATKHFNER